MTPVAKAAQAIRAELKKTFPAVKFSVTSKSYSMGNEVNIQYTNGPRKSKVEEVTKKYQYGHFNGMEDMYEISNERKDLPQAKFVTVCRKCGDAEKAALTEKVKADWSVATDAEAWGKTNAYIADLVYREFCNTDY